ncbi:MAG: cyclic nucleotide-binding domain-containing protein [bacterium]|nr:MAG: cyclic nucleotide-binding domain-containing protein [bacterium]
MTTDELGRDYEDGEVVFREGEEGNVMFVIQRGRVRVSRTTGEGEVTIATLGPGDVFGEMALFEREPRSATVTAMENSRILSIDKTRFFQNISRDPSMAFNLLRTLSERLRRIDKEFTRLKKRRLEILRSGMDLKETCRVILEEASDAVQAENGSVMVVNPDDGSLDIVAAYGTDTPEKARLTLGEGIAGNVLATGSAELINNVTVDPRFKPGTLSITSIICVPLSSETENFGVINLSHTSNDRLFSKVDLQFVKSLSVYASVAVRNAISLLRLKRATEFLDLGITSFPGAGEGDGV